MVDKFAEVNGIKICYEIFGEGDPLVLVHGFGDRKEHFQAQIGDLSEYFKVITIDNRGAGKSDRPNGPYTMDIYIDDINALLEYLKIRKTNILGHSLGGMIVQNFILKYPIKTKKAILINTIPGITPLGIDPSQGIEIYRKNAINTLKALKTDPLKIFLDSAKHNYSRNFWKQMNENPKKKFYGLWSVEDLIEEKTKNGPTEKDINNQAEALKTHNVYERLSKINNDVLIIAADKDKTCPKAMNEKLHELIPNSKFVVLENASHQSILEYPHEVNQYIIDFLKD
jgi:proline-specific peptidase